MAVENKAWYILFQNHTQGLILESLLKQAGFHPAIVPTPRALSKSCGIALSVKTEELTDIRNLIEEEKADILDIACMEMDINPRRDKFC